MPFAIRYWATKDDFDDNKGDGIPVWGNAYEKTYKSADKIDQFIKKLRATSQFAFELGEWDGDEDGANIDWSGEIVYIDRPIRYKPGSSDHKIICKYLHQNDDVMLSGLAYQVYSEYIVFEYLGTPYLQLTVDLRLNDKSKVKWKAGLATPLDEATQKYIIHEDSMENFVNNFTSSAQMFCIIKNALQLTPEIVDGIAKAIEESISV